MKNRIPHFVLLLALAGLSAAAAAQHQQHQPHQHHAMAAKSGLAIGAGFAPDGKLWQVGLNQEARLTLKTSADDGKNWTAPRILDTGRDHVAADGEARPKLAFGPHGVVVIAYTNPLAKPYTGEIRMLRSADGGQTFAPPFTVHRDRQVITHRFESIAFDAKGRLHTLWVDKRDLELRKKQSPGQPYRGAAIYHNISSDGGLTFGDDLKLADYSCECCRIALAPTPDGSIAALWRHVFEPNIRDHAFALLSDTATPQKPVRATFDNWAVDACPHHGPGLAAAAGGGYHAVWFDEKDGEAQVRYGRLDRSGAPASTPIALPDERAEHADVASAGNKVAIAWRSFDGKATSLKAWISNDAGRHFTLKQLARTEALADNPLLLQKGTNGQIFVIWNTQGKTYVEAL
jgi:hypothetical protein